MNIIKKVYDIHEEDEYPYVLHLHEMPQKFSVDWFEKHAIPCSKIGRIFFFKREEDRLSFIITWCTEAQQNER